MQTYSEELEWQRLHGAALFFGLVRIIRSGLVSVFFLYLWARNSGTMGRFFVFGMGMLVLGLPFIGEVLRFMSFRYCLDAGNVIIREGIFSRKIRRIPVKRIHNINTSQGILARMLRVVRLDIETAGSSGTEGSLMAVSMEEAARVQDYVREEKSKEALSTQAVADEAVFVQLPPKEIFKISLKDIFIAGATTSRMGLIFVALYAGWEYLDGFFSDTRAFRLVEDGMQRLNELDQASNAKILIIGFTIFVGMFFLAWLLSIGSALIRWYRFTLEQNSEDLNIRAGLFTLRAFTIPLSKIQALRCNTSFFRRPFGLMQIKVTSAGHVGIQEKEKSESDLLVPITHKRRTEYFVKAVWPKAIWNDVVWQNVHPYTLWRQFRIQVAFVTLAATLIQVFWWQTSWMVYALILAMLFLFSYVIADLTYRQIGYAYDDHFAYLKTGFLGLQYWVIPISKIQNLAITQTPFQRYRNLASLKIDVAGQLLSEAQIPNIDVSTCWRLFNRFGHPNPNRPKLFEAYSGELA